MKRLKHLLEERARITGEMNAIMEACEKESRSRSASEKTKWEALNTQVDEIGDEIKALEKMQEIDMRSAKPKGDGAAAAKTPEDNLPIFTIYERSEPTGQIADWHARNHTVPEEIRSISPGAFIRAKITGAKTPLEQRAIETAPTTAGGFYVPEYLSAKIFDTVRAKSHVLSSGAQTVLLDSGNQKIAKLVADPTAAWVAESGTITASDPTFDAVAFSAKKLVSRVDASGEWLQDAMNGDRAISMALTGALAGQIDYSALLGAGSSTVPKGIYNYTNVNTYEMDTNGAGLGDYDAFLETIKLMFDDNAEMPDTAIMAPRSWLALSKMKDQNNQPLQPPKALANMKFLQTSKIPVNQTQGTASNASCIFLGGFENLYLGLRLGIQIIPTMQLVAEKYQYSFLAVSRLDWQPFREEAFGLIKGVVPQDFDI